jgi:hypothetical protein
MAHEFKIMDTTGTITTYTDYDSIPLASLLHVISFIPDIGTLVHGNEILIETDTLDSGETDKFVTESTLTSIEVELETATSTGGLLLETGDDVRMEDITRLEERTVTDGVNIVLDGSDSSSANAGGNLIAEFANGRHRLVPESFATGSENHLVFETSEDNVPDNHYHPVIDAHHEEGDGHTEEQHREIALWSYKLNLLLTQEDIANG